MRSDPPVEWGEQNLASTSRSPAAGAGRLKWAFFAIMGLAVLLVIRTDERFWLNPPIRTGSISRRSNTS